MRRALIVFAKYPEAGAVKTRLTAELTEAEAAELYRAFVEDALEAYTRLRVDVRLYIAGRAESRWTLADAVFEQRGDGLGQRMRNAFAETFEAGYEQAVIVGTDHPTLPPAFIVEAFDVLEDSGDVVIGPAEDGGYYLLGMTEPRPELFGKMDYSHERVFRETLARTGRASVTVLPSWYDVDRPEELLRLRADLRANPERAPRTHAALEVLAGRYPWLND